MPHFSYDSLSELVESFRTPIVCAENKRLWAQTADTSNYKRGWFCADRPHVEGWAKALKELDTPLFPQGVARIENQIARLAIPSPVSIKRKVHRSDHGDELDMQRVWQGDLDRAWSRAKRTHTTAASRVFIGICAGLSYGTKSDAVAWRGVAALALCDALESNGYVVRVVVFNRSAYSFEHNESSRDAKHDMDVTIKGDGEQLDLHKAASLVASTLLARGIMYQHCAHYAPHKLSSGWAYCEDEQRLPTDVAGFDLSCIVPTSVNDEQSAQAWLTNQSARIDTKNKDVIN